MIRLSGISFGYGVRIGAVHVLHERSWFGSPIMKRGSALTFPSLPSVETFNETARSPGVEFCIIPPCSSYSHLAATIWSSAIPTIAIQYPSHVPSGASVFVDFDNGLLLVAESESEVEELYKQERESTTARQAGASDMIASDRSRSAVEVLAEITSASDMKGALDDGADGLSVVNAENLFHDTGDNNSEVEALIRAIKSKPQLLPLPIRFFDSVHESRVDHTEKLIPQKSLGYRGVRILEVDDAWFKRFVAGIEALDLEQIIVVLPMVTSASEVRRFRDRLEMKWDRLGVTVETPAAALRIKELLEVSTYIQIGLNDLTQYTMAWDRDVPNPERLPTDRIAEPVADLIASVAAACITDGVPYTLGMDLRPSENLALQLFSLGVTSVSCAPSLIKPWKNAIALSGI